MIVVTIREAKTQLSRLVRRLLAGQKKIVVAKAGVLLARLLPHEGAPPARAGQGTADRCLLRAPAGG
jgi:antitoxin (DNA-binding transcriptional repressor) of toxin-antitoxin stability system